MTQDPVLRSSPAVGGTFSAVTLDLSAGDRVLIVVSRRLRTLLRVCAVAWASRGRSGREQNESV